MDDFYSYVNKDWLKQTTIPDEFNQWGTFTILQEKNKKDVKSIIENDTGITGILYNQGLNKYNPNSIFLVQQLISRLKNINNIHSLFSYMMNFNLHYGINLPVGVTIHSDFSNADFNILYVISGGIGLPNRDYYFLSDKQDIRNKYKEFIKEYVKLFRDIQLYINEDNVFNIETQLAEYMYTKTEERNPDKLNNPMLYSEFIIKYPNLSFVGNIFKKLKLNPGKINVTNIKYIEFINNFIINIDLQLWKEYFYFRIILSFSKYLNEEIELSFFNFFDKYLNGIKSMKTIQYRSIETIEFYLGELVGKMYVQQFFDTNSKNLAIIMVKTIKKQFEKVIKSNDWMEEQTKNKALEKLSKMRIKIGYPDKYEKNYNKLDISKDYSYLQNILNIKKFNKYYEIKNLYQKLNRDKWFMPAHLVNAYYSPSYNEIVFPAGILQEPMFSIKQSMGANFGGIGMIIGHEITHGFDDQGSKFDADGNLKNWWTENDKIKYKNKTSIIKNQYSDFKIEGKNLNGELTLGENIADIEGLRLSLNALKSLQLGIYDIKNFFINYANIWKSKYKKENILQKLINDPHSPAEFRVNGAVRNIDEFYKVFNIDQNSPLFLPPNLRAKIW